MSEERLTIDDPRLTAYVLDELREPQRTKFEADLSESPQLRAALDELRHAAAQVFAALQAEPGMALTDEQLERIRTAAYSAPSSAAQAVPARVAVIGSRPGPHVSPRMASSAIVLAGLVLTTAALILSAHFPRPGVDGFGNPLPEVVLFDDSSNRGLVDESLSRQDVLANHPNWDDMAALTGPALNYDALRRAYRIEVPNNGRVEGHYVTFVAASTLNGDPQAGASGEGRPEPRESGEVAAENEYLFSFFNLSDLDAGLETNGALNVEDLNRNGRLDDDALWFAPAGYGLSLTAPRPSDASIQESLLGLELSESAPATLADEAGAAETAGEKDVDGDGISDRYYVVPLLAQPEPLQLQGSFQRGFSVSPDGAPTVGETYYERRFGSISRGAQAGDEPVPAPDTADHPGVEATEALRRLIELEASNRTRFRATTEALSAQFARPDPVRAAGGLNQSGGAPGGSGDAGQQDGAAPASTMDGFGADFDALVELVAEEEARLSSERTRGGASGLYREGQSDGEPLRGLSREPLGEAVRRHEAEIAEREATIQQWQRDYRELQAEKEQLNQLDALGIEFDFIVRGEWPARTTTGLASFGESNWAYTPGTESYAPIVENDFLPTLTEPVSTFSIDVDTGAYANCRRFINSGMWPPADAVRIEELVNAFTYGDPVPEGEHPIAVNFDVAACPWQPEHRLVRIGVRAADIIRAERPPTRLVFLIDVSGSMKDANKLPLVQQSLRLLVDELGENDRVAIVTYANDAALRLESTSGDDPETILTAVNALGANGSTNGEGGLRLAYQVAEGQFEVEASNRVILCTDGDFNVGESSDSELVRLIEQKRESGVFLSVFGFGTGNLEDAKLEQIADHGNGHYGYVDSLDEAKNIFVHDLTGTLYTVAKDVKLQVDFNPTQVLSYRLIGYENRALANADFDNDTVDAGDVGAGHSVTALYQVAPRKRTDDTDSTELAQAALDRFVRSSRNVDANVRIAREGAVLNIDGTVVSEERRLETGNYVTALLASPAFEGVEVRNNLKVVAANELPPADNDLLKLRVRYKRPHADESRLFEAVLVDDGTLQSPSADFQWASAVASYGMLLRQSRFRGDATFDAIIETAQAAAGDDPHGRRREFIDLVQQSRALYARQTGQSTPEPVELTSIEARDRAACDGRYSNLLDKLEVPEDLETYGAFRDYGYWAGESYRTHTGLPAGYWVYVYPHWYIWADGTK